MNTSAPLPLRPSLYADTAVAPTPTPPLTADKNVAVAIVGGGFTGLSTALHLAEQGVDVAVLEAQQPGWGASGNNGGQLNPGLKHDPDQIEADFGADLGGRMIAFGYGTTNATLDLIRRYQIPCEARQNGTLRAAYNEASAAGIPKTIPSVVKPALCRKTKPTIPCLEEPSAIRIPISRVRRLTVCDIRPNNPSPHNSSANPPKQAERMAVTRS